METALNNLQLHFYFFNIKNKSNEGFCKIVVIALVAGFLYSFSSPVATPANDNNAAYIMQNYGCGVLDGEYNLFETEGTIQVITSSGHAVVICNASNVPNQQGKAINYFNLFCNTDLGYTLDVHETLTPSGQATLRCFY